MEDAGGKSGRRPGSHLQVEAYGPGNATSVQQRLACRFRRGEVAEGCAGGAEGRSKGLICLRQTYMRDTGGKSGRRPGRHLPVEASGPGNAAILQRRRLSRRFRGRGRRVVLSTSAAPSAGARGRAPGRPPCWRWSWLFTVLVVVARKLRRRCQPPPPSPSPSCASTHTVFFGRFGSARAHLLIFDSCVIGS